MSSLSLRLFEDFFSVEMMERNEINRLLTFDRHLLQAMKNVVRGVAHLIEVRPCLVLLYHFMGPNSTGRSVVSFCVTVLFQGHESVALGYECFHLPNNLLTFHYKNGGTFSAFFHVFIIFRT